MPIQSDQITLDGSGNGTIRLPPVPPLKDRYYPRLSVSINTGNVSAVTGGECRVYMGEPLATNFITGTRTPWLDTATLDPSAGRVPMGQYLSVQFTNCDPGAIASINAEYVGSLP